MKRFKGYLGVLVFVLVLLSLPYWLIPSQFALRVAILTAIFAGAGVCWNLIGGVGGQLSFGHSVYFGIGAYTSGLLYIHAHLTPIIGIPIGALIAAVAGAITTFPALRLRGVYFSLTTFVMALLFQDLAAHFRGLTGGDSGLSVPWTKEKPVDLLFADPLNYYFLAVVLLGLVMVAFQVVVRSKLGVFLRAVRDDEDAARAAGVDVPRVKLLGLLLSAIGCGLFGGLFFQLNQFIDPPSAFGLSTATSIGLVALAGGVGVTWGPVFGAVVLIPTQQYLSAQLSSAPAGLSQMVYGVVVVVIIVIDRRGLWFVALSVVRALRRLRGHTATSELAGAGSVAP